jgi:dUTP pyrophosphatase
VPSVIAVAADTLSVRLLDPRARPPARTREGDAGYDLRCLEGFRLAPGERAMIGTGVAIALPPNVAGLVTPRSGLAARHGISLVNSPGLVDPNYRGELRVVLVNLGAEPFEAQAGDRIAQLLLIPFWAPELEVVAELPPSDRGPNGFGSSGSA